jgi:hypothetical protein
MIPYYAMGNKVNNKIYVSSPSIYARCKHFMSIMGVPQPVRRNIIRLRSSALYTRAVSSDTIK